MQQNVQSGGARYRRDIDGLRAVAVVAVLGFHAFPEAVPGGFAGVDVFFVVSGYLISGLVWSALGDGTFTLRGFYARRIRRIFPALGLVLAACLVIGWLTLLPPEYARLGRHTLGGATFVSNFVLWRESGYFDRAAELKPLLHLWSLAIEEQFYIVWPLLLLAARRLRASLVALALFVLVVSFAANVLTVGRSADGAFYAPSTRAWELALGALMVRASPPTAPRIRDAASFAGAAAIVGSMLVLSRLDPYPGWAATLPTTGTCLVVLAGRDAWLNRRVLSSRAFVFVGLISYPLYLWHWPLLSFARVLSLETPPPGVRLAALAVAALAAHATYTFVERPIRAGRTGTRTVAGLAAIVAALGALGVVVSSGRGLPFRIAPPLRQYVSAECDLKADADGACWLSGNEDRYPESCLGDRKLGPAVLLWGDSHAARLAIGVKQVIGERARVAQYTQSSCPPLLDYGPGTCASNNAFVVRTIREEKPAVVVLFANWVQHGRAWAPHDRVARLLERTIGEVAAAGTRRVVVIGPAPQWKDDLPRALATATFRDVPRHRVPQRMTFGLDPVVREVDGGLGALLATSVNATYISSSKIFCNEDGCLTRVDDEPDGLTTCDYGHLTTKGAAYFVRALEGAVPEILRPRE